MPTSITDLADARARLRPPMPERRPRPRLVDAPAAGAPPPEPAYHPAERRRLHTNARAADLHRRLRELDEARDMRRGRITVALLALLLAAAVLMLGG